MLYNACKCYLRIVCWSKSYEEGILIKNVFTDLWSTCFYGNIETKVCK